MTDEVWQTLQCDLVNEVAGHLPKGKPKEALIALFEEARRARARESALEAALVMAIARTSARHTPDCERDPFGVACSCWVDRARAALSGGGK